MENDLIIISDEIHCDILMPGFKHTVLQTLSDELAEITVTCTAPTKSFNLAGIGVSNIIIKNKKLRKQFEAQMTKDGSHVFAALGFKACELAYNEAEEWFDQFLKLVDKNQKMIELRNNGSKELTKVFYELLPNECLENQVMFVKLFQKDRTIYAEAHSIITDDKIVRLGF